MTSKITQTYFFSSAESKVVSADGSTFTARLDDAIALPQGAIAPEMGVLSAAIWSNTPNLGPGLGAGGIDNNKFQYTTSLAPAGTYNITFPTGQYQLSAIAGYLSTQFTNNGHPSNLFSISGQEATGFAYVTILTSGDSIHFEQVGSVGSILGFPAAVVTATAAGEVVYGTTGAALNSVNSYLISSPGFAQGGIPNNTTTVSGLLAVVPINVRPGRQINFSAQNVMWTPAAHLIGKQYNNIPFRLTNESGVSTSTAGESWSFVLQIRFRK